MLEEPELSWNFEKFLVSRSGEVVERFAPDTQPDAPELVAAIEAELATGIVRVRGVSRAARMNGRVRVREALSSDMGASMAWQVSLAEAGNQVRLGSPASLMGIVVAVRSAARNRFILSTCARKYPQSPAPICLKRRRRPICARRGISRCSGIRGARRRLRARRRRTSRFCWTLARCGATGAT